MPGDPPLALPLHHHISILQLRMHQHVCGPHISILQLHMHQHVCGPHMVIGNVNFHYGFCHSNSNFAIQSTIF
jgi:hypothetical protein